MSGEIGYAALLFTVGSLEVYELRGGLFASSAYYWKLSENNAIAGPFNSIRDCTNNYEYLMHYKSVDTAANVIHIDFRKGKRLL